MILAVCSIDLFPNPYFSTEPFLNYMYLFHETIEAY